MPKRAHRRSKGLGRRNFCAVRANRAHLRKSRGGAPRAVAALELRAGQPPQQCRAPAHAPARLGARVRPGNGSRNHALFFAKRASVRKRRRSVFAAQLRRDQDECDCSRDARAQKARQQHQQSECATARWQPGRRDRGRRRVLLRGLLLQHARVAPVAARRVLPHVHWHRGAWPDRHARGGGRRTLSARPGGGLGLRGPRRVLALLHGRAEATR